MRCKDPGSTRESWHLHRHSSREHYYRMAGASSNPPGEGTLVPALIFATSTWRLGCNAADCSARAGPETQKFSEEFPQSCDMGVVEGENFLKRRGLLRCSPESRG